MIAPETIDAATGEVFTAAPASAPLAIHNPSAPPSAGASRGIDLPRMMEQALAAGQFDALDRLLAVQERLEGAAAKRAFDQAMASASAEFPVVIKSKDGHGYKYEDIGDIADAIRPILGRYGLSYRFQTSQQGNIVRVACVVSHIGGYSVETALEAPTTVPGSGKSPPVHGVGSTVTYLQRYTLKAAFGLAASKDDDGMAGRGRDEPYPDQRQQPRGQQRQQEAAPAALVSEEQIGEIYTLLDVAGASAAEFCGYLRISSLEDMRADRFPAAVLALQNRIKRQQAAAAADSVAAQ